MNLEILRFASGAGLLVLLGRAASRGRVRGLDPGELALDGAIGLSLAAPAALAWLVLGMPLPPRVLAGAEAAAAIFLLFARRTGRFRADPSSAPEDSRLAARVSALLAFGAFAVCVWKWARVPLWSWDHFAIWGVKARRLFPLSSLDTTTLHSFGLRVSNPNYPLGLPLVWRLLALGEPGSGAFRASHGLFALGALFALRAGTRRATGSALLANALAGALCVSPLFWDSEALGLAEMPLAFLAVASAALLLGLRHPPGRPEWAAGVTIGYLAWIKQEGMVLACLLLLAGVGILLASRAPGRLRAKSVAALVLPAIAVAGAGAALWRLLLPPGLGFFVGDWPARGLARLRSPMALWKALAHELLAGDWLGLWIAVAAAFAAAMILRRPMAALLLSVVAVQIAGYAAVYVFTYLDPVEHIASSFFRIVAGTVPLALLGAGLLAGRAAPECGDSGPGDSARTP
ncbi:MAG: hypothetical protein LC780_03435 [Acidobacteria bacterium]|nr:hypothetical protein [Acidobacteriota bacterium]